MADKRDLYKESGVDVEKGDALVEWLQAEGVAKKGARGEVVSGIGGFAALFKPNFSGMAEPLLVSGTDGVGTKVLLGIEENSLEGLGIDLVAMCVNDLYTVGGEPLFFLDYYATGVLDGEQFKAVLSGIKKGLAGCGAVLLGGETAELPGLYAHKHFDLAGFVVGVVDGEKRLKPEAVEVGDTLIALESSGFHSNGYSLIRKWLNEAPVDRDLMQRILAPTRIYSEIPQILRRMPGAVHGLANITGGGISGNLPRVLPDNVVAEIDRELIPTPAWMKGFCERFGARFDDVEGVFNLGAGMIAAVKASAAEQFVSTCEELGLGAEPIGRIKSGQGPAHVRYI